MNLWRYILFLLGQVGMMSLARFFFQWIINYAEKGSGNELEPLFALALLSPILLFYRVLGAGIDPWVGSVTDAYFAKGVPRKKFILAFVAVAPIGLILCFFPDASFSETLRWAFLLPGMAIFFLGYAFYAIPYWSLIEDYAQGDMHTRAKLSNLLGLGMLLATAVGFVISPLLVDSLGYSTAAIIFAIFAMLAMLGPYFSEPRNYQMPANGSVEVAHFDLDRILLPLKQTYFTRNLILLVGIQMALTILTSASPYVAVDLLHGHKSDVSKILAPFLISAMCSCAIMPGLARKVGSEKSIRYASYVLCFILILTSQIGGVLPGTILFSALLFGLVGPCIAASLSLEGDVLVSCAEHFRPGWVATYFAVFNFVVQALNGLALCLTGLITSIPAVYLDKESAVRLMILLAAACVTLGLIGHLILFKKSNTISELDS